MAHKIAIIGASLGGIVAAAEFQNNGCDVTIFEKGDAVGGLYGRVNTPFGDHELGMHVIYAGQKHYKYLCDIFGSETFDVMRGAHVDLGASANFGQVFWGSHYPNLINHPLRNSILAELISSAETATPSLNAEEEAIRRFGATAAHQIVLPIIRKLWRREPKDLSIHALHCFYDLRRIVIAEKFEADRLKDDAALDAVVANPDQLRPKSKVFEGRMGLLIRDGQKDLSKRAENWASNVGITLHYRSNIEVVNDELILDGTALSGEFDACLVALPVHVLAGEQMNKLDKVELTIFYVRLERSLGDNFPSYYILTHDPKLQASRIVNYDSYRPNCANPEGSVIAVEAIHPRGCVPSTCDIASEIAALQPSANIAEVFQMPRSLSVVVPSLLNGQLIDAFEASLAAKFAKPIFFTGMRTDTGIFFSHHTIGLAYDSALECFRRLS